MKKIATALILLITLTACNYQISKSEYCEIRASALSGSPAATRSLVVYLQDSTSVKTDNETRQAEYALFSKLLLRHEGIAARSHLILALEPLEWGMPQTLPHEPEVGVCVESATSLDEIDSCMSGIEVWVNTDLDNPPPCPFE